MKKQSIFRPADNVKGRKWLILQTKLKDDAHLR